MDSYGKMQQQIFDALWLAAENNREADGRCMNEVGIQIELPPTEVDDFLGEQSTTVVDKRTSDTVSMTYDDQGSAELMSFCRVAVANQEELDIIFQRGHMHYST